ncbi:DUF6233 domain-containing protein [Streptomyces sp. NPDC003832]
MGSSQPPVEVHAGNCHTSGRRRRNEARWLLATGLEICTHCQPDTGQRFARLRGNAGHTRPDGTVPVDQRQRRVVDLGGFGGLWQQTHEARLQPAVGLRSRPRARGCRRPPAGPR